MTSRVTLEPKSNKNYYFTNLQKSGIAFVESGCKLLDCVLGGGWPLGRISNVVGNKSSGKTLLAIEACTNFNKRYPDGKIYYLEAEAAFDQDYANALGMPVDAIEFTETENTIEALFEELEITIAAHKKSGEPGLFVVDSLDALSDRAELNRKIDEGSYGGNKPKKLSELFRRLTSDLEKTKIHLMVVSQIRDNIGVLVGPKHTRAGGKALDFYASQVLWLTEIKKHSKTSKGIKRVIGIQVKALCKKNKVGLPYRECDFPILFGYGVDDTVAHLEFLNTTKMLDRVSNLTGTNAENMDNRKLAPIIRKIRSYNRQEAIELRTNLDATILKAWEEIEQDFIPEHSKY